MNSDTLTVISSHRAPIRWRELLAHRELVYFLTLRDIQVRYKQTIFGVAWALLQPLMTVLAFSLFFGRLARMPSDGIPYPVFSLAALIPWTFFANGLAASAVSVTNSANLITKVYFPRLAIPLSTVAGGLVDLALSIVLLVVVLAIYRVAPGPRALFAPMFVALAFLTTLGTGLWLSAMTVQFRDVKYVVPFLSQLWLFSTPIAYPASLVPARWQFVYGLNPMVGVIEGFRWSLFRTEAFPLDAAASSTIAAILIFVGGLAYFRRTEDGFADVV